MWYKYHDGGVKLGFWAATPVVQPSGADQAGVTLGNTDGVIGGLTISDPPKQAEVRALRDACEELADDVRALSALVHALRGTLVAVGWGLSVEKGLFELARPLETTILDES